MGTLPTLEDLQALALELPSEVWRQSSDVAQVVANYLRCHPCVVSVRYPGLKTDPLFSQAATMLQSGFGPYVWYETTCATELLDFTNTRDAKQAILELEQRLAG